jgi:peptidoglycan/LPS O-acetylase OafA/YrhL
MVFFVLSGYLIGRSIIATKLSKQWCWTEYILSRLTRLWVVLVPALILTALWDVAGITIFGGRSYHIAAERLDLSTLVGNLFFLQAIACRLFGSNDALWSLSYEFWFYIAGPLLIAALMPGSRRIRFGSALGCVLVLLGAGRGVAAYFAIWLLGAGLNILPVIDRVDFRKVRGGALVIFVLAVLIGKLVYKHESHYAGDLIVALGTAALMYVVLHDRSPVRLTPFSRAATALAGCSYTLYATHMPIVVFIGAAVGPGLWTNDRFHVAIGLLIAAALVTNAYLLSLVTEARTGEVRQLIKSISILVGEPAFVDDHDARML